MIPRFAHEANRGFRFSEKRASGAAAHPLFSCLTASFTPWARGGYSGHFAPVCDLDFLGVFEYMSLL